jgi:hypothetical protein
MEVIQPAPEAIRGELPQSEADWRPSTGIGTERCGAVIMSVIVVEEAMTLYNPAARVKRVDPEEPGAGKLHAGICEGGSG